MPKGVWMEMNGKTGKIILYFWEKIKEEDDVNNEVIVTENIVVDLYKNHANKLCPHPPPHLFDPRICCRSSLLFSVSSSLIYMLAPKFLTFSPVQVCAAAIAQASLITFILAHIFIINIIIFIAAAAPLTFRLSGLPQRRRPYYPSSLHPSILFPRARQLNSWEKVELHLILYMHVYICMINIICSIL